MRSQVSAESERSIVWLYLAVITCLRHVIGRLQNFQVTSGEEVTAQELCVFGEQLLKGETPDEARRPLLRNVWRRISFVFCFHFGISEAFFLLNYRITKLNAHIFVSPDASKNFDADRNALFAIFCSPLAQSPQKKRDLLGDLGQSDGGRD